MKVLIDNGHGENTPGKCSPDKRIREYLYCREIAARLVKQLKSAGIDASLLTPELTDVPLSVRVARANVVAKSVGRDNTLLISIHLNAAGGDSKWHPASGWTGWVAKSASARSRRMAQLLYTEAERAGLRGNRSVPAQKYWSADFKILRSSACPAVLTENLFQDNLADVDYLLTEKGKEVLVNLHFNAILNYINEYGK